NKGNLNTLAQKLMKKETLTREEILKILSKVESKKVKRVERLEYESRARDVSKKKSKKSSKKKKAKPSGKK
ncbi:MAG: hypothetical protein U9O59_03755, partial [Actinomycetota bacterium]|nr:hypothetical protein [Actinomycetota bacterium]